MSYAKRHMVPTLTVVLACLSFSGWFVLRIAAIPASASSPKSLGTKIVNVDLERSRDAVTITKVTVDGVEIQPGVSEGRGEFKAATPFQSDEEWLRNMSISLLNRTDKPIICAQIQLWFPDTGNGTPANPMTSYTITLGHRPESSLYYADGSKIPADASIKPLLFAPGETLVVALAPHIQNIQSTVEGVGSIPFSQVTRVNIRRANFYFVDGMRWDGIYVGFYVPSQDRPGKYVKLDENYFPGHLART